MNHYVQSAKTYILAHKREFSATAAVALGVALLVLVISLFTYTVTPHYAYQPVKACDLFTPAEAQDLLGGKVIKLTTKSLVVSGNVATSKCSYTDDNPDTNKMLVAAVAVRSAVEDEGITANKSDFATAKSNNNGKTVEGLGDSAYFNEANGQLNVLHGHQWIILSYGVGSAPQTNSVDKTVKLARKIIQGPDL